MTTRNASRRLVDRRTDAAWAFRIATRCLLAFLILGGTGVRAADVVKANNTTGMNQPGSWVGGVLPGSGDTVVFNDTYQQGGNLGTGAPLTYMGMRVTSDAGPTINIHNTTAANHIELLTGGLDMSAALRDLIIQSVVVGATQTWNVNTGATFTVGGTKLEGSHDLAKQGGGTVVVAGNGTGYSGNITIDAGTLQIGDGGTGGILGSGNIVNHGQLVVNRSNAVSMSNVVSGTGSLTKLGGGELTLTADNAYTGGTVLHEGALRANHVRAFGAAGSNVTLHGGTLQLAGGGNDANHVYDLEVLGNANLEALGNRKDLIGALSGAGTLNVAGSQGIRMAADMSGFAGTLIKDNGGAELHLMIDNSSFGNAATTSGSADAAFVVNAGRVYLLNNTQAGTASMGALSGTGGILNSKYGRSGNVTLEVGALGLDTTYGGVIADGNTGSTQTMLSKVGAGTLTLTGAQTYTGSTSVSGGTLRVTGTGGLYMGSGGNFNITVSNGASLEIDDFRWDGSLGKLWYSSGNIVLNNGTLRYLGTTATGTNGRGLTIGAGGATLEAATGGEKWTLSNHADSPSLISTAGGLLTLTGAGDGEIGKVIPGSGGLVKSGVGTWALSGAHTYTGSTTVSDGTLSVANGQIYNNYGWANQTITVEGGGILEVGGWADGDSLGLGRVSFAAANLQIDNGTIRYTGAASSGNSDRGFTIGAGGAILEAAGTIAWTLNQGRNFGITSTAGGTLTLGGNSDGLLNLSLGGNGGLVKNGTGTWTLTGAHAYSGDTNVDGGTLRVAGTLRNTSSVTVNAGATLETGATNIFVPDHGTAMANSRVITVDGGTWLLNSAMDSRLGNVTLRNGATWTSHRGLGAWDALLANTTAGPATVTVSNTGGNTSPSMMDGSGGIHLQGMQNFNVANVTGTPDADLIVSMILDGSGNAGGAAGGINKLGDGTMLLAAANTYNGNTTVSGGTLRIASGAQIYSSGYQAAAVLTVENGGVLEIDSWNYGVDAMPLGGLRANNNAIVFNDGTVRVRGATNYGRGFTILAGGATLEAAAGADWTLAYDGNHPIVNTTGGALTLSGAGNGQMAKVIPGSGDLRKTGSGTWTLTAANTYSGGTNVDAGTLLVSNAAGSGTGSGAVLVHQSGTLGGTGSIGGTVTIGAGGTHAPGASVGSQTVGGETWLPGGAFQFEINDAWGEPGGPAGWDLLTVSGTLDLTGLTEQDPFLIDIVSLSGTAPGNIANFIATQPEVWPFLQYQQLEGEFSPNLFDLRWDNFSNDLGQGRFEVLQLDNNWLAIEYVPEPGAWLLLLSAVACGMLMRRRRSSMR